MGHAKSGRTHQNLSSCGWRKSQRPASQIWLCHLGPRTDYLTSLNLLPLYINMSNKYKLSQGLKNITNEEYLQIVGTFH